MGWCYREGEDLQKRLLEVLKDANLMQKSKKLLSYSAKDVAKQMIDDLKKRLK